LKQCTHTLLKQWITAIKRLITQNYHEIFR